MFALCCWCCCCSVLLLVPARCLALAAAAAACPAAHPDEHAHVDLAQAQKLQDLLCLQAAASNTHGNAAERQVSLQLLLLLLRCCIERDMAPAGTAHSCHCHERDGCINMRSSSTTRVSCKNSRCWTCGVQATAAAAYLGVDLVQTTDADHEGQLGLWLHIEATVGLGLTPEPDGVLLLQRHKHTAAPADTTRCCQL
jgi:hypothetical protein